MELGHDARPGVDSSRKESRTRSKPTWQIPGADAHAVPVADFASHWFACWVARDHAGIVKMLHKEVQFLPSSDGRWAYHLYGVTQVADALRQSSIPGPGPGWKILNVLSFDFTILIDYCHEDGTTASETLIFKNRLIINRHYEIDDLGLLPADDIENRLDSPFRRPRSIIHRLAEKLARAFREK